MKIFLNLALKGKINNISATSDTLKLETIMTPVIEACMHQSVFYKELNVGPVQALIKQKVWWSEVIPLKSGSFVIPWVMARKTPHSYNYEPFKC